MGISNIRTCNTYSVTSYYISHLTLYDWPLLCTIVLLISTVLLVPILPLLQVLCDSNDDDKVLSVLGLISDTNKTALPMTITELVSRRVKSDTSAMIEPILTNKVK